MGSASTVENKRTERKKERKKNELRRPISAAAAASRKRFHSSAAHALRGSKKHFDANVAIFILKFRQYIGFYSSI
jgi:hypothetical protein